MFKQRLAVELFSKFPRRARVATIGVLAVAALGLSACSSGGLTGSSGDVSTIDASLAGSIDDAITKAMEQSGSTEAIVGVWGNDGGEYVRAYGSEKINGGSPIRGAQATQPAVCAVLMDMAGEGDIDLDEKISEELTRQVGIKDVTYRQLCDMRSGIADFKGGFTDLFANNPTRLWPEQELIAQGLIDSPRPWPGLNMYQSDTNAVLLARVLRVKSGQDTGRLLSEHVFDKAGMGSSYFPAAEDSSISDSAMTALTYPSSGGKPVCDAGVTELPEVSPSMLGGAGGTVTTVTDLKNLYTHFFDGTFGGEEMAKLAKETIPAENPKRDPKTGDPTTEPDPEGRQWGFGMEKQGPLFGRVGAITGTLTAAYHDPDSNYTVVVALNNSSAGAAFVKALAFELAAISAGAGVAPEVPWSAEDQQAILQKAAVCQ